MRLSETVRKELYLARLREKLIKLYSYGDAEPDARKRLLDQIDGYNAMKVKWPCEERVKQGLVTDPDLINRLNTPREENE